MLHGIKKRVVESSACLTLAGKMKKLAERIIRHNVHVGYDDMSVNGERWIAELAAPNVSTFFDVGANRGDFSHLMLSLNSNARGAAFEPALGTFKSLQGRLPGQLRVTLNQMALADRVGTLTFYEEPNDGLSSSLSKRVAAPNAVAIEVPVSTVDIEAERLGFDRLDFLKIDAEGFDVPVIKGASGLLAAGQIDFVQFEYHTTWRPTGHTLYEALNIFADFNYRLFLLKGEALFDVDYERFGEYYGYSNYLAVSPAAMPKVMRHIRPPL